MTEPYPASQIKRKRRSNDEIAELWTAMHLLLQDDNPMTVRQVFYQMASHRIVDKTESGYNLVQRNLAEMRRADFLPFTWIADNTRWMRKPKTYPGIEGMLDETLRTYRRALWQDQDVYVEVWCEKDALAGVILNETFKYDVPLMVGRGFSSLTYIYNAAQQIREHQKETFIYYFGDYDPSGVLIPIKLERDLRQYAPEILLSFQRVAINPDQIEEYQLPTRPTKKSKHNAHGSLNFADESVDLDALPASKLRELARQCIERHIDPVKFEATQKAERLERETLQRTFGRFNAA